MFEKKLLFCCPLAPRAAKFQALMYESETTKKEELLAAKPDDVLVLEEIRDLLARRPQV